METRQKIFNTLQNCKTWEQPQVVSCAVWSTWENMAWEFLKLPWGLGYPEVLNLHCILELSEIAFQNYCCPCLPYALDFDNCPQLAWRSGKRFLKVLPGNSEMQNLQTTMLKQPA